MIVLDDENIKVENVQLSSILNYVSSWKATIPLGFDVWDAIYVKLHLYRHHVAALFACGSE